MKPFWGSTDKLHFPAVIIAIAQTCLPCKSGPLGLPFYKILKPNPNKYTEPSFQHLCLHSD